MLSLSWRIVLIQQYLTIQTWSSSSSSSASSSIANSGRRARSQTQETDSWTSACNLKTLPSYHNHHLHHPHNHHLHHHLIISIILILFTCDGFCWIVGWLAIRDQIQVAAEANQIINIIIFSTYIIIKNITIIICIFTIIIIIFSIYIIIGTCVICIAIMISRIRNLCGYRYWSNWTEQPAYCKRWWRWWSNNITATYTAIPLNSL